MTCDGERHASDHSLTGAGEPVALLNSTLLAIAFTLSPTLVDSGHVGAGQIASAIAAHLAPAAVTVTVAVSSHCARCPMPGIYATRPSILVTIAIMSHTVVRYC